MQLNYNLSLMGEVLMGKVLMKIKYFHDYFKYLKNPISCLLFKFGLLDNVELKLKSPNKSININDEIILNKLMIILANNENISNDLINFFENLCSDKKIIPWFGANILNFRELNLKSLDYYYFLEYFLDESFQEFDINYSKRTVIDIGSNVGDSCLFFAINGADVYGYEPMKNLYDYSLEIKKLNPQLADKIHLFNFAVSDHVGELKIENLDSVLNYKDGESYTVELTTIDKILETNNIPADILKMDCEGAEFDIILNSDLSEFKDIIFEHHSKLVNKNVHLLTEKLELQGFKINILEFSTQKFEDYGLIHAYK